MSTPFPDRIRYGRKNGAAVVEQPADNIRMRGGGGAAEGAGKSGKGVQIIVSVSHNEEPFLGDSPVLQHEGEYTALVETGVRETHEAGGALHTDARMFAQEFDESWHECIHGLAVPGDDGEGILLREMPFSSRTGKRESGKKGIPLRQQAVLHGELCRVTGGVVFLCRMPHSVTVHEIDEAFSGAEEVRLFFKIREELSHFPESASRVDSPTYAEWAKCPDRIKEN